MTTNSNRVFSTPSFTTAEPESAPPPEVSGESRSEKNRCRAFLADLTEVCARHRVGIAGDAVLFVMEPEDFPHSYSVDPEGRLYRR